VFAGGGETVVTRGWAGAAMLLGGAEHRPEVSSGEPWCPRDRNGSRRQKPTGSPADGRCLKTTTENSFVDG